MGGEAYRVATHQQISQTNTIHQIHRAGRATLNGRDINTREGNRHEYRAALHFHADYTERYTEVLEMAKLFHRAYEELFQEWLKRGKTTVSYEKGTAVRVTTYLCFTEAKQRVDTYRNG